MPPDDSRIVLICGYSGAGKSVALKTLADLGFEAIDNAPIPSLETVIGNVGHSRRVAICADARTRGFSADALLVARDELAARADTSVDLVFLTCDPTILLRRFTETRHRHPLAADRPVTDGIALETVLLQKIREQADLVIDTSEYGPHDLKRALAGRYGEGEHGGLTLDLVSFSYKKGIPREADMVLDVRFLENPHYIDDLRPQTGREPAVADYIRSDSNYAPFFAKLSDMLDFLMPLYAREGKSYFTLAIGCTGGRHRSVHIVEALAESLAQKKTAYLIRHREIGD